MLTKFARLLTLYVCALIVVFSGRISAQNNCLTPDRRPGECIPIKDCQFLTDIIKQASKPLSALLISRLRSYTCDPDSQIPRACCPNVVTPVRTNPDTFVDVSNHRNLYLLSDADCGFSEPDDKIHNGNLTAAFEFKFMALISYRDARNYLNFQCGGSLINENYVLTAAHCITQLKSKTTIAGVRLGEHNIATRLDCDYEDVCAPPVQDVAVSEIITHPEYNPRNFENDIGLIRLATPAKVNLDHIKPICLPRGKLQNDFIKNNLKLTVAGWGVTETGFESDILLKAELPYVPNEQCQKLYNSQRLLTPINIKSQHICAGGELADSCGGDSGGPLFKLYPEADVFLGKDGLDGRYVQHGIVSFGPAGCNRKGIPAVYANVGYYMQWILDNLRP